MRTLCRADVRGSRLKLWKTKPSFVVRTKARSSGERRLISWPSNQNWPELGRSRQPRMFMSVVLPEPGRPHQGHHFAAGDGQGNAFEHGHVHFAKVVGFGDVFQADELAGDGRLLLAPLADGTSSAHRGMAEAGS